MKTLPNSYYYSNKKRNPLLKEYINNIITYYKTINPNVDDKLLIDAIKSIIKDRFKSINVDINDYISEGNIERKTLPLLKLIDSIGFDKLISVHGVAYLPARIKESFFTPIIESEQANRKIIKKEMIQAQVDKKKDIYNLKNFFQKHIKIGINAISGLMVKNVFFRSTNNYNAITGTVRYGIMAGYSFVELFINGNMLFENEDDAINYITQLIRIYPGDDKIKNITKKFNLYIPTAEDVKDYIMTNLRNYVLKIKDKQLLKYIDCLSSNQRIFIYYAFCMKNLLEKNDATFKALIKKLLEIDKESIDPNIDIEMNDNALIIMIASMFPSILEGNSLYDALNDPKIVIKFKNYYSKLHKNFTEFDEFFDIFIRIPFSIPKIIHHHKMLRNSTLLSDTDSVIFTLVNIIKWYMKEIKINDISLKINAIMVYLISIALDHVFAYLSAGMNIDTKNIKKIVLKNEYLYSVFVRCGMSKHYFGYNILREGNVIDPPELDIKGKNFIGSDLPDETLKFIKDTIIYLLDTIIRDYSLSFNELVKRIVDYEQKIIQSLKLGKVDFVGQKPINEKSNYTNYMISIYYNYMMYTEVFGEKYEKIHIPQKCKSIPIYPISSKNLKEIEYIKDIDPDIYDRFVKFMKKFPKKELTHIVIPLNMDIPEEIRPLVDYRSIVYKNCFPIYVIYKSFGITNIGNNKKKLLFSDFY